MSPAQAKRTPRRSVPAPERDALIAGAIEAWFAANARDLPWRKPVASVGGESGGERRDPYHSLVSELMLQQTQVSRVVDRFQLFIERFPTVADLAAAPEQEVLALWSGLGYYRRARLLQAAARAVVADFDAVFPDDPQLLQTLPGVGRYTAGAVASMALGRRTPVVDGNVTRVLLRIDNAAGLPDGAARTGDKRADAWAWTRAESLVTHANHPGPLNEGLMELGATVCTPMNPRCDSCPVSSYCLARAAGAQDSIPAPKQAVTKKPLYCAAVIIRDSGGRLAVECRPASGMWAGLWQAPTLESAACAPSAPLILRWLSETSSRPGGGRHARHLSRTHRFVHSTTHRDVRFDVWHWSGPSISTPTWQWITPDQLDSLPLSSAQRKILLTPAP